MMDSNSVCRRGTTAKDLHVEDDEKDGDSIYLLHAL
jgi:hypothetical protein